MLNVEKFEGIAGPFPLFVSEECFEPSTYKSLASMFPSLEKFQSVFLEGKRKLDIRDQEFAVLIKESGPLWQKLIEELNTQSFVDSLKDLASTEKHTGKLKERLDKMWVLFKDAYVQTSENLASRVHELNLETQLPVKISFEFSHLTDGSSIPPHTDSLNKLISIVLFFPDDSLRHASEVLGTNFYETENTQKWSTWDTGTITDSEERSQFDREFSVFYRADFCPNAGVCFFKNELSWHGLPKISVTPPATRKAFIINIFAI